jgi:5'-nucleotidase
VKKKFFLTNDDGVQAAGIKALEKYLIDSENSFISVAPLYEQSGSGHSITLHSPLKIKKFSERIYAVSGTPTDSVFIGLNKIAKEMPTIAVSGINRGANLGNDITYSGTVAAAVETFYNGITSFAVSLYIKDFATFDEGAFDKAAKVFFKDVLPKIEKTVGVEELYLNPYLFNINIPADIDWENVPEICWTSLGKRYYGGEVIKRTDPRGNDYFWIGGDQTHFADIPGSDCNAIKDGCISVTPLKMDFTDKETLENLKTD